MPAHSAHLVLNDQRGTRASHTDDGLGHTATSPLTGARPEIWNMGENVSGLSRRAMSQKYALFSKSRAVTYTYTHTQIHTGVPEPRADPNRPGPRTLIIRRLTGSSASFQKKETRTGPSLGPTKGTHTSQQRSSGPCSASHKAEGPGGPTQPREPAGASP